MANLRDSTLPGELKELTADEIRQKIHEFYLVTMNGESVGCFRIFSPESAPGMIELGSVVSRKKGVGRVVASFSEGLAKEIGKNIIAITGESYGKTLSLHGWENANGEFPLRMSESNLDKVCWKKTLSTP